MANAAVPQARRDDGFERADEAAPGSAVSALPRQSWLPAFAWAAFAAVLFGFLVFGSVLVGAGTWTGRRMRISQIWTRFLSFLEDQGATAPVISVVVLMLAVALIGGVCLVWLAARLPDQDDTSPEPRLDS